MTKICELGACFLYLSYVLAQNGVCLVLFHLPGSTLGMKLMNLFVMAIKGTDHIQCKTPRGYSLYSDDRDDRRIF